MASSILQAVGPLSVLLSSGKISLSKRPIAGVYYSMAQLVINHYIMKFYFKKNIYISRTLDTPT